MYDVLTSPAYVPRAEAFRREIAGIDGPRLAAQLVERLARTGRPVTSAVTSNAGQRAA